MLDSSSDSLSHSALFENDITHQNNNVTGEVDRCSSWGGHSNNYHIEQDRDQIQMIHRSSHSALFENDITHQNNNVTGEVDRSSSWGGHSNDGGSNLVSVYTPPQINGVINPHTSVTSQCMYKALCNVLNRN